MKKPYRNKFIRISNINNSYMNRYKIRYTLGFLKFTVPNKAKLEFFKNKKEEKKLVKYYEYKKVIDELNKNRKNKNPILTIILLTYNHKSTIEKCINSLLNQETQYDYIIKICDDASTDGTTKICFEYAKKYSEKIEYILQPKNTKCKHFIENLKNINTEYWCFIDGDDYWITNDKIEKAINFLNKNSDYSIFATDVIFKAQKIIKSYAHAIGNLKKGNQEINFDNYVYMHPSGRIHRNVINWNKEFLNLRKSDIYLYILSMTRGKCFFYDEATGCRNYTGRGLWSQYNKTQQEYISYIINYTLNRTLSWKYDKFFSLKRVIKTKYTRLLKYFTGHYIAWKIELFMAKRRCIREEINRIKEKYKKIEEDYYLRKI
mgnify:CR=1 FL=1